MKWAIDELKPPAVYAVRRLIVAGRELARCWPSSDHPGQWGYRDILDGFEEAKYLATEEAAMQAAEAAVLGWLGNAVAEVFTPIHAIDKDGKAEVIGYEAITQEKKP